MISTHFFISIVVGFCPIAFGTDAASFAAALENNDAVAALEEFISTEVLTLFIVLELAEDGEERYRCCTELHPTPHQGLLSFVKKQSILVMGTPLATQLQVVNLGGFGVCLFVVGL